MRSVLTSEFRDPSEGSRRPKTVGPVEPPPSQWRFPDIELIRAMPAGYEVVAMGADLSPGSLLAGYRVGLFGMYDGERLLWWSPDPRGVLHPGEVHVARSMRRVCNRLSASLDYDFAGVLAGCADPRRTGGWITGDYTASYLALHELGWAHSIEVWDGSALVAGLFGVQVGALFAAESMFHDPRYGADASRLAVIALCQALAGSSDALVDVQWPTAHLTSLGVVAVPRSDYLRCLPALLARPPVLRAEPVSTSRQPYQTPAAGAVPAADQPPVPGARPNLIRWVTGPAESKVRPK